MRARTILAAVLLALPALPLLATPTTAEGATSGTGVLASFDGTLLVYSLHLPAGASADSPVPVVLRTHGWAGQRDAATHPTVAALLDAGYAVFTWDSRGFGQSGGMVELDSPDFEVKDVSAILDHLATRREILLDAPGDPRAGMSGVSYAGGIQLLTSAFDPRVDALAPEITWNDLRHSLWPNGVLKQQWVDVLFGSGLATGTAYGAQPGNPAGPQATSYDTNLPTWFAQAQTVGAIAPPQDVLDALWYRSPGKYATDLAKPTLLVSGFPDTLFTVNEALSNFEAIAPRAPAKMLLYCGGHSGCPHEAGGQDEHVRRAIVTWMDRHLSGNASVDTGPTVEYYSSDGTLHAASAFPPPALAVARASGHGTLASAIAPTSHSSFTFFGSLPADPPQPARTPTDPTGATSFRVPLPIAGGSEVTGVPRVTIEATSLLPESGDAFLVFRLVDVDADVVVDGQSTPWRVTTSEPTTIDLVAVSYDLPAGHTLALEVATSDSAYGPSHVPAAFHVHVTAHVPVVG